ncbi:hypothetical protein BDW74DRAFT_187317 [Aspergillus multicolor]|uniref:uncharacterized protein n=1 Tax=Aspergillus multicolor TaxID=41759 RepID=UPI003CCDC254
MGLLAREFFNPAYNTSTQPFDRYAKASSLARYVPELDPDSPRGREVCSTTSKRTAMLAIQIAISSLTVALIIGLMVWAVVTYPPNTRGVGTFSVGNCTTTTRLNSALHVALNILASLFLGAGNYCMQILVAPSRAELNKAHSKGKTLEIGVPSLKNLLSIGRIRVAGWVCIGVLATILHIFWNSTIFTSLPIAVIPRALVTNDFFVLGENWTASDSLARYDWWEPSPWYGTESRNKSMIYGLQNAAMAGAMTYLNTTACVQRYTDPMNATGSLIIVARNISSAQNNGSSLIDGWVSGWEAWEYSASWICRAYQPDPTGFRKWARWGDWTDFCNWEYAKDFAGNWTLSYPVWMQVDHCLVGEEGDNDERCGLHYSVHIVGIVLACTVLGTLMVCWCAWWHSRTQRGDEKSLNRTMVTMGDAAESFLDCPQGYIDGEEHSPFQKPGTVAVRLDIWRPRGAIAWFNAVSLWIWVLSLTLFAIAIAVTSRSVASSIRWVANQGVDIWHFKFRAHPAMVVHKLPFNDISGRDNRSSRGLPLLLGHILVANAPQVVISFLYIFYNNLLTRQLVAAEWVRFLQESGKKGLRVSSPRGMQRSSYFLSLPLSYSVPLIIASIGMHWLISQSIFVVQASAFAPGREDTRMPLFDYPGRGYSPLWSVVAIVFGVVLVVALLLGSCLRRYRGVPNGFVRMGFNSGAIRAVCLRPPEDTDAAFFPLRIGVVSFNPREAGRIVFSTDTRMRVPEDGALYWQPVFVPRRPFWRQSATALVSSYRDASSISSITHLLFRIVLLSD